MQIKVLWGIYLAVRQRSEVSITETFMPSFGVKFREIIKGSYNKIFYKDKEDKVGLRGCV